MRDQLVYLLRHGEVHNPDGIVYADLEGYGLSDLGRAQAAAAAGRLPGRPAIVSSPLQRAVETADIIAGQLNGTIDTDEALTEWHLGRRWAGHAWATIDDEFPGELTAYLDHPEQIAFGDETLQSLADRVAAAIRRHRARIAGPLVIVSHQDPIQAGRLALADKPLRGLHRDKPQHAAVLTMASDGGSWIERGMWAPDTGTPFPPI